MAYSQERKDKIFEDICREISLGKSTRKAIKESPIATETFWRWIDEDTEARKDEEKNFTEPSKSKRYARATQERADTIFEEMLEIADNPMEGEFIEEEKDADGKIIKNKTKRRDMYNHRRLQVDTTKFMVAKLNPNKYGEAQLLKIGDADGKNIQPNVLFPAVPILMPESNVQTDSSPEEDTGDDKTD